MKDDDSPWVVAFWADAALPSGVFGPVLCCALRRLAADLRLELIFVSPYLQRIGRLQIS